MAAINVEDSIEDALRVGVDEGYSRLPVYEDDIDHVIGVLYIKDLLPYVGQPIPENVSIRHLIRDTYFVPGTKKCGELFSEMTEKHIQMSIIVDEYGGVAGIVTMEDLLESIVGNIQDEYDNEEEEVTRLSDNAFDVEGSLDMEDLSELLGIRFPEGEYDTLAGFLMDQLGRIPDENEQPVVTYENAVFTIKRVDDRRIERVHIELTPPPPPGDEDDRGDKGKKEREKEKDKEKEK